MGSSAVVGPSDPSDREDQRAAAEPSRGGGASLKPSRSRKALPLDGFGLRDCHLHLQTPCRSIHHASRRCEAQGCGANVLDLTLPQLATFLGLTTIDNEHLKPACLITNPAASNAP